MTTLTTLAKLTSHKLLIHNGRRLRLLYCVILQRATMKLENISSYFRCIFDSEIGTKRTQSTAELRARGQCAQWRRGAVGTSVLFKSLYEDYVAYRLLATACAYKISSVPHTFSIDLRKWFPHARCIQKYPAAYIWALTTNESNSWEHFTHHHHHPNMQVT